LLVVTNATVVSGTLRVFGDGNRDDIVVRLSQNGSRVIVTSNNVTARSLPVSAVRRLFVDSGGNSDLVQTRLSVPTTVSGGDGNDVLTHSSGRGATLIGGAGADRLIGGRARDRLDAGEDDGRRDTLIGNGGDDLLILDSGGDVLNYDAQTTQAIRFVGGDRSGTTRVEIKTEIDTIVSESDEGFTVFGTPGPDVFIRGDQGRGNVRMVGGAGDDTFIAGAVASIADGGDGNDSFTAAMPALSDTAPNQMGVIGGNGDDRLRLIGRTQGVRVGDFRLGEGVDTIDMSSFRGRELTLRGEQGIERLTGIGRLAPVSIVGTDAPESFVASGENSVTIDSAGGRDTIIGSSQADLLRAGGDFDSVNGAAGDDTIFGGDGGDTLRGGPGRDQLFGEALDDFLFAENGDRDTVDGGDGFDNADLDEELDTQSNIEIVFLD
jgi:Ca2+-binding RTX toxin-like protein